jgi:RNA-directed DNA polymerase
LTGATHEPMTTPGKLPNGGRKSTWALSHSPAVDKAMPTVFFTARGLIRLVDLHRRSRRDVVAPSQPQLALEWG